jgi:carbon-monoxide dehydrogenase small subunit
MAPVTPEPVERIDVRFTLNGEPRELSVTPDLLLVRLLRDRLGLTGTKEACSVGVCGVCSVLVDGELLSACLLPAVRVDGRAVTTVEGLAGPDGSLSAVQEAFVRHGGFQCGICTPGQVVAATGLLAENPSPSEAEVRDWLTGNLCRCTGYYGIVASVLAAAGAPPPDALRPPLVDVAAGEG